MPASICGWTQPDVAIGPGVKRYQTPRSYEQLGIVDAKGLGLDHNFAHFWWGVRYLFNDERGASDFVDDNGLRGARFMFVAIQ